MSTAWLGSLAAACHQDLLRLPEAHPARVYLTRRNVTPDQISRFRLGYAGETVTVGGPQPFMVWAGRYLHGRLVFPLTDVEGTIIGLQSRALDRKDYRQFFAYATTLYPYFFGLAQAIPEVWRTRQLVIVEGVFDCLAVSRLVPNVVAVLTAGVPVACRRFFRRYVNLLTVLLDMDPAGRRGASRLVLDPDRTYRIRVPAYPAHDPSELLARKQLTALTPCLGDLSKIA